MLAHSYRLQKRWQIQKVLKSTHKYKGLGFTVLWLESGAGSPRFAFIASKKVGKAVVRNRAARLLRESIRLLIELGHKIPLHDYVIIAQHSLVKEKQNQIQDNLANFFTSIVH